MLPYLKRREPALAPVIERLAEEHVGIHHILEEVDQALVRFITEPDDGAAMLQEAVYVLTDTLLSHLSYEERELTVPLARYGMGPGQL